ncbi:hypothetical protein HO133_004102 [Letharia lupina]|uniref:Uncharacterized protein n=1 Tax=Letharia lupina TaxID=560253 RepID=A0A8H6F9G6_9LECA|nr:uncharacterized protein HO133_004102 [Letharia lupina]KAF6219633.1 hypothetical protein HO133_004102 [Letharia lupina]
MAFTRLRRFLRRVFRRRPAATPPAPAPAPADQASIASSRSAPAPTDEDFERIRQAALAAQYKRPQEVPFIFVNGGEEGM